MNNLTAKQDLRQEFLQRRASLGPELRDRASRAICASLIGAPELAAAKAVGAFVSDGVEPDLSMFIEHAMRSGIKIYLPRFAGGGYEMVEIKDMRNDLIPGKYGIMEPLPELPAAPKEVLRTLIWLTPGVVFDSKGSRLGRGKGVYDRLLNQSGGLRIGIFYQCQENPLAPAEAHDCPLDMVVTENGVRRFK